MRKKGISMAAAAFLLTAGLCSGCGAQEEQQFTAKHTGENGVQDKNQDKDNASQKTTSGGEDEYYIFDLNENVERTAVTYQNRYGIRISGDLYMAKDLDKNTVHPALIIGPPYGGVKEQGPGVYANELAQRGFIVLTFDPSFNGESGGEPRHVSSPDIFTEDFSAGVDNKQFCIL